MTKEGTAETTKSAEIFKFCRALPKVQLHEHLHGSVRESTLRDLLLSHRNGDSPGSTAADRDGSLGRYDDVIAAPGVDGGRLSLAECFAVFAAVHAAVRTVDDLRRIAREALEDLAAAGVCYAEIRSTPRPMSVAGCASEGGGSCTLSEYIRVVTGVMREFEREEAERYRRDPGGRLPLVPRYIVSVDRSKGAGVAVEIAKAAVNFFKNERRNGSGDGDYVVGMDLGGNPHIGSFENDFEPAFRIAREAGMKVSIHCGEIPCGKSADEIDPSLKFAHDEAEAILSFRPDRLGHSLFLPTQATERLASDPIPVECCPTSNVLTIGLAGEGNDMVEGLRCHPGLPGWLAGNYPIVVSTDDPAVFGTDPARELALLHLAFGVPEAELAKICLESIQYVFEESERRRADLLECMRGKINKLLPDNNIIMQRSWWWKKT